MRRIILLSAVFLVGVLGSGSASPRHEGFTVTVLGAHGGLEDGNLSAYLVQLSGDQGGILLDAGTVLHGLQVAWHKKVLDQPKNVLEKTIRGYAISHAHMDHIAGLIAVSPEDTAKPIYALPSVIMDMTDHVFNNHIWPNMGDSGSEPRVGRYHYSPLVSGKSVPVVGTEMRITAYPLGHGGVESSAFLLETTGGAILYLGDTGPDTVEPGYHLHVLWQGIAPILRMHRLMGIMLECSYDDSRPRKMLFGHLTPSWFMAELHDLQTVSGMNLHGMRVIVTHMKPSLQSPDTSTSVIMGELKEKNDLGVKLIPAQQGQVIHVP
nr:3',5'-cyclic-nucleotide phosphodiesterase [uncultured Neokomagataea sp.]